MNEARRQGCQRLDRTPMPWEENAHARLSRSRDSRGREQHRRRIRRSGLGGRENLRSPGQHCTAPERPCGIPATKVAPGAGNTTRCGCTQFVWVAEIVWTHRVSSPPPLSQDAVTKEGASLEEARSPADVGREQVEGETVRGRVEPRKFPVRGLWVSARRFTNDEGVPGLLPASPSRVRRSRVLRLAGQARVQPRDSTSDGKESARVCLRVTTERQRSIRYGEGSTRPERDHGGSASSTRKRRRSQRCVVATSAEAEGSE